MGILINELPQEIQQQVNKLLSEAEEPFISIEERYNYAVSILNRLQKVYTLLEDIDELIECSIMIKNKKKEVKELEDQVKLEKRFQQRKLLQKIVMSKALEL